MTIEDQDRIFNERTSGKYTAYLTDELGAKVPIASLESVTLNLHLSTDPTEIINGRENQDALNDNNVVITETTLDGEEVTKLVWSMLPGDTAIVGDTPIGQTEKHIATFDIVWDNGDGRKTHEVEFEVKNLSKVS